MFEDCAIYTGTDSLSQGIILKFPKNSEEERYGIIITGDCDIAQDKYGKFLSYCYIESLKSYFYTKFIPRQCKQMKCSEPKNVFDPVRKINPELVELSDDVLIRKVFYDTDSINTDDKLKTKIENIKAVLDESNHNFETYARLRNNKAALGEFSQLPKDKFYINDIKDPSESESFGFIVNLRRIREITADEITVHFDAVRGQLPDCFIISKLKSPHKEKLTQQLAIMFASIGDPEELEQDRKMFFKNVIDDVYKEINKEEKK